MAMRLSSREWTLFAAGLGTFCLLVFLAAVSANSSGTGAGGTALAAAAVPTVSVQEKEQEAFSLTVDERGLRSDWRSPEENGSLRIDVNNGGLQIRAKGTSAVDAASAGSEPSKRCTCDCGCGH